MEANTVENTTYLHTHHPQDHEQSVGNIRCSSTTPTRCIARIYSPSLRGVYSRYTPSRGGIIDLSHDVNALEATGSSKKLAACNFNRARYIKHIKSITLIHM